MTLAQQGKCPVAPAGTMPLDIHPAVPSQTSGSWLLSPWLREIWGTLLLISYPFGCSFLGCDFVPAACPHSLMSPAETLSCWLPPL